MLEAREEMLKFLRLYPRVKERSNFLGFSPATVQKLNQEGGIKHETIREFGYLPTIKDKIDTVRQFEKGNFVKMEQFFAHIHTLIRLCCNKGQALDLDQWQIMPPIGAEATVENTFSLANVDFASTIEDHRDKNLEDSDHYMTCWVKTGDHTVQVTLALQYWDVLSTNDADLRERLQTAGKAGISSHYSGYLHSVNGLESCAIIGYDDKDKPILVPDRLLKDAAFTECKLLVTANEHVVKDGKEEKKEEDSEMAVLREAIRNLMLMQKKEAGSEVTVEDVGCMEKAIKGLCKLKQKGKK